MQLNIVFGDPKQNMEKAEAWLAKAAAEHCSLAVLPELWTTGYDLTRLNEIADEEGKAVLAFLKMQAKKHQLQIIGGSIAKRTQNGVRNTMYVVNKNGELIHEYSKLHLFQLMDEHVYFQPGEDEPLFLLDGEQAASFICYDIRFPEWLRKPVLQGAKVLFVVAEWPLPRLGHWQTLLKARAIENQCYIIACNRSGKDPHNHFAGHSMIIDPWGTILSEGSEGEELVTGEVDLNDIQAIRQRIPVFDDRRPDFYK